MTWWHQTGVLTSTDTGIRLLPIRAENGIFWGLPEKNLIEFVGDPMRIEIKFIGYYFLLIPDLLYLYNVTIDGPSGPIKIERLVLETSPLFEGEFRKTLNDERGTVLERTKFPNYWKFWEKQVNRKYPERAVKIKGFVAWDSKKEFSDQKNVIKELILSIKIIQAEMLPE